MHCHLNISNRFNCLVVYKPVKQEVSGTVILPPKVVHLAQGRSNWNGPNDQKIFKIKILIFFSLDFSVLSFEILKRDHAERICFGYRIRQKKER